MDSAKTILDAAAAEYFAWLRQILTISSAALTLLIALRSQIVPEHPHMLWLLQLSWIALMAAIAFALFGTAGHHKLLLRGAGAYRRAELRMDPMSEKITVPGFYLFCGKMAPICFLIALLSLGGFGVLNIGTPPASTQTNSSPASTTAPTANGPNNPEPNTSQNTSTNASSPTDRK